MFLDRCNVRTAEISVGLSIENMSQSEDEKTKQAASSLKEKYS